MKKDAPEPTPPPTGPTREVGLHRCPFCHEVVAVDDGRWVGCASCLARHHAACWDEGKACGACKHTQRLVPERAPESAGGAVPLTRVLVTVGALMVIAVPFFLLDQRNRQQHLEVERQAALGEERLALERLKGHDEERTRGSSSAERLKLEALAAQARAAELEQERDAARREAAAARAAPAAHTLELVVHGLPAGLGVVYALSPSGGHDGSRSRVTGALVGGRALVAGYSSAGPVMLDLEWDRGGTHYRRVWLLEATSDRLEVAVPLGTDDAMVLGRVAPGLASVMAFGSMLSARCDVGRDGSFVLTNLPPDRYALVGYGVGHSPHSGAGGLVVELGPKARVTLEAEVPPAR